MVETSPKKLSLVQWNGLDYWAEGKKAYLTFPLGPTVYDIGAKSEKGPIPGSDQLIRDFLGSHTRQLIEIYGPDRVDAINGLMILREQREAKKEPLHGGKDHITVGEEWRTAFQLCRWVEKTSDREKSLVDVFGDPF